MLADLNKNLGAKLETERPEIESLLEKGLKALREKDYAVSIQYLEKVAEITPASTIYQNIAYAYEQMGKTEQAQNNLDKAKAINPNLDVSKSFAELKGKRINLLAPENGGKMDAATSAYVGGLIDGKLGFVFGNPSFGVFSFKDGKKATFNQFETYVPEVSGHGDFKIEISYGNDSPTGTFTPLGSFTPYNGLLSDQPFQSYSFPPVTAKYVKITVNGWRSMYEVRLLGMLE